MKLRTLVLLGAGAYALVRVSQRLQLPPGVRPVQPFELTRFLGRWYEVARIDQPHERGISNTTLDYQQQPDGSVRLLQRGFRDGRWRTSSARVEPVDGSAAAHLQLSIIWPLRASHVVFELDDDYQHALVSGPTHDQLRLLARTPQLRPAIRANLLERARAAGFDVERLLWVDQRRNLAARRPSLARR